jgi:hypothetical protein
VLESTRRGGPVAGAGTGGVAMNTASLKQAAVRLVGLGALVGVTVLLTLLFSILGNLTCAVLAGLVFGSGRRWQWLALPCSLVFPGVILLLSHYSKVELPAGKVWLIALLAAAAFWSVMGLTRGFRFVERKADTLVPAEGGTRETAARPTAAVRPFDLELLRGNWSCESPVGHGLVQGRTLRIEDGRFELLEHTRRGRDRVVARGTVSANGNPPRAILLQPDPESASAPKPPAA